MNGFFLEASPKARINPRILAHREFMCSTVTRRDRSEDGGYHDLIQFLINKNPHELRSSAFKTAAFDSEDKSKSYGPPAILPESGDHTANRVNPSVDRHEQNHPPPDANPVGGKYREASASRMKSLSGEHERWIDTGEAPTAISNDLRSGSV